MNFKLLGGKESFRYSKNVLLGSSSEPEGVFQGIPDSFKVLQPFLNVSLMRLSYFLLFSWFAWHHRRSDNSRLKEKAQQARYL
jgi:hypothetical protein